MVSRLAPAMIRSFQPYQLRFLSVNGTPDATEQTSVRLWCRLVGSYESGERLRLDGVQLVGGCGTARKSILSGTIGG